MCLLIIIAEFLPPRGHLLTRRWSVVQVSCEELIPFQAHWCVQSWTFLCQLRHQGVVHLLGHPCGIPAYRLEVLAVMWREGASAVSSVPICISMLWSCNEGDLSLAISRALPPSALAIHAMEVGQSGKAPVCRSKAMKRWPSGVVVKRMKLPSLVICMAAA